MNKENELQKMSLDNSETESCPNFNPEPRDEKSFVFDKKLFVKAKTRNFLHIPLNMGSVIPRAWKKIEQAGAGSKDSFLTKVFEGPYREAKTWVKEMEEYVRSKGKSMKKLYFFT
jgi:hypothetical protein